MLRKQSLPEQVKRKASDLFKQAVKRLGLSKRTFPEKAGEALKRVIPKKATPKPW